MVNVSFTGWEVQVTVAGATVAVAESIEVEAPVELEEVLALGSPTPVDVREIVYHSIKFRIRRAYFVDATAADFFTVSRPDANGYQAGVSITMRLRDNSTGVPADKTYTITGCKFDNYGIEATAGRGVVRENISGMGRNMTRA